MDTVTKVVNCKVAYIRPQYENLDEWIKDKKNNVYVARAGIVFINITEKLVRFPKEGSIFANPFKINEKMTRDVVMKMYKKHLDELLEKNPELKRELVSMRGKNLGCWCHPEPCHADILVEKIEMLIGEIQKERLMCFRIHTKSFGKMYNAFQVWNIMVITCKFL